MQQQEGYVKEESKDLVCLLKKALYGLKQSLRQRYKRFNEFMTQNGFPRCIFYTCVYLKTERDKVVLYLLLYVDDMLMASKSKEQISEVKQLLKTAFETKDLGPAKRILGMNIMRNRSKGYLFLSQRSYLEKVLQRFNMHKSKHVTTPLGQLFKLSADQSPSNEDEENYMDKVLYASAVCRIMYAMACSRPDIAHAVSLVSRFMAKPGIAHWEELKWILRYIRGSFQLGLKFCKQKKDDDLLRVFVGSNYAGSLGLQSAGKLTSNQ